MRSTSRAAVASRSDAFTCARFLKLTQLAVVNCGRSGSEAVAAVDIEYLHHMLNTDLWSLSQELEDWLRQSAVTDSLYLFSFKEEVVLEW